MWISWKVLVVVTFIENGSTFHSNKSDCTNLHAHIEPHDERINREGLHLWFI